MGNSDFSSRTERDNLRLRGTGKSKNAKKAAGTDVFIKITVLQAVICFAVIGVVAAVCKLSPAAAERLKNDYASMMSENMSIAQVIEQIGGAVKLAFLPSDEGDSQALDAFSPFVSDAPELAETQTDAAEEYAQSFSVISDETGETVAVAEFVYNGSGGGDLEKGEAIKGTSFAPYSISAQVCLPVENARITSPFGYRINPVSGNYGFHTGIDLAAPEGTPVSAAFYGRIKECGEDDVWGKYILIEHSDNCETYYCHLSEIYVDEGAVIRQGETVGLVGSTGWSTGPHLHFEVRIDGVRVDPEPVLYPDEN